MQRFTDSAGHEWRISINGRTLKEVRDVTGIMLTTLVDEHCQLLAELYRDPLLLADILWVLVEEQAEKAGLTVRDFAEAFGGDCVGTGRMALIEATIDFFDDPETRAGTRDVLRKTMLIAEKLRKGAMEKVNELDIDSAAQSILDSYTSSLAFAE